MRIVSLSLAVIFSLFATAVMSYIAMATPIGPWIAPTIVLIVLLLLKIIPVQDLSQTLAFVTIASSIGGILATACGFSYPTLYFLDSDLFQQWLSEPFYFCTVLTGLSLAAGAFGFVIALFFEHQLIVEEQLSFPIGQLVYKMIAVQNQVKKAYELVIGCALTLFFCLLQDGIRGIGALIPKAVTLVAAIKWDLFAVPLIRFDLLPMLWAIGFVTGHVIAIPLAVGAVGRIFLVDTAHALWFTHLSVTEFVLAFCSGMVVYGAVMSFSQLPPLFLQGMRWMKENGFNGYKSVLPDIDLFLVGLITFVIAGGSLFLYIFQFSIGSMAFLFAGAFACIYQIIILAGKIGLAPLGRFATFVMVPAMLLFGLNTIQTVFVATFVEICGGVAADVLFGRKVAYLMQLDRKKVFLYQLLGLLVSACIVGVVFFFLIKHFGLGSAELFAYKAQSRALLIEVKLFDYWALALGALFSFFLQYIRVNAMLVLGGLLMPINISLGLIFGGILTMFVKNREEWEPFWSGVFAANSIWMLLQAILS